MRIDLYKNGGYGGGGISENGGSVSGPLVLAGNPSQTLEAAPKQYVDAYYTSLNANNFTSGIINPARLPAFTGDLTSQEGTSVVTLSDTGITPGSYGKVTVNNKGRVTGGGSISDSDIPYGISWNKITTGKPTTLSGYGILDALNKNGGTLTGFLTVNNQPTLATHIANKSYVDSLVAGGGIAIGDIIRKPYSTTPIGFLKCNGAEVDKTTYANLYAAIGDSFASYTTPGSGQPWKQQYQINTSQSTDITGWSTDTSLPGVLTYSQAIITKNRIYLCGGSNGSTNTSTVYTGLIYSDGTINGWTTATSLPIALIYSSSIVVKNRVYLFGGENGSGVKISTIYTAPINSDGTLGTWTTYSNSLPGPLSGSVALLIKNKVYLLGGHNGSTRINTVYISDVSSDGTLGAWTTGSPIPATLSDAQIAVTKNRVYLLGGFNGTANISTVYTAPINADGTLGTWSNSNDLPYVLSYSQSIVTKNRVYLLGGNSSGYISTVLTAPINADGTLGTWVIGTSLPGVMCASQAAITKNKIYIMSTRTGPGSFAATVYSAPISGGLLDYSPYYAEDTTNYVMPGSGQPWRQQYDINTTQSTDITGWAVNGTIPMVLQESCAIVTKNRVYILGGNNGAGGGSVSNVYTAPINTDGTLGTWSAGTSLPGTLAQSQAIVTKNRVYLLGGWSGSSTVSTVYTAPINADGTLGTWTTGTALPVALAQSQAIVTKNRVYLLGGYSGTSTVSTVYTAPINADGTLGTWTTGISLAVTLRYSQVIVTKNRVYLLGGFNGSAYTSAVYTATINSDGLLSSWSATTSLPGASGGFSPVVTKNRVYFFRGYDGSSAYTSTVYTAPINADGTLGTWSTGTSLSTILGQSSSIVTKNKVYLFGGQVSGGYTNNIYSATISGDLNDYSPYYDGTIVPNSLPDNSTKFMLPDLSSSEQFNTYSYIKY